VKAITEELCGHAFSASAISAINKRLDESLEAFAGRPLEEPFAYLILDARYEKVREGGVVTSQAVLIAIGVDWDGRRQILAVEMANRESRSSSPPTQAEEKVLPWNGLLTSPTSPTVVGASSANRVRSLVNPAFCHQRPCNPSCAVRQRHRDDKAGLFLQHAPEPGPLGSAFARSPSNDGHRAADQQSPQFALTHLRSSA
jgi:hypothetical protein